MLFIGQLKQKLQVKLTNHKSVLSACFYYLPSPTPTSASASLLAASSNCYSSHSTSFEIFSPFSPFFFLLTISSRIHVMEICSLLLPYFDVSCKDEKGRTPLHLAVVHSSLDVAACLLQTGASLTDTGNSFFIHLTLILQFLTFFVQILKAQPFSITLVCSAITLRFNNLLVEFILFLKQSAYSLDPLHYTRPLVSCFSIDQINVPLHVSLDMSCRRLGCLAKGSKNPHFVITNSER